MLTSRNSFEEVSSGENSSPPPSRVSNMVYASDYYSNRKGGAGSHILAADDGAYYVTKFQNNPQGGRRMLVNEAASSIFLRHLQIATPEWTQVSVSSGFIERTLEKVSAGTRQEEKIAAYQPGVHFGSQYPGDPRVVTAHDLLPEKMLQKVTNLNDFRGARLFDQWAGNVDGRQAIFYKEPETDKYNVRMIDHGYAFYGNKWRLTEIPSRISSDIQAMVFENIRGYDDLEPWLTGIREMPTEVFDRVRSAMPECWLEGDEDNFDRLLDALYQRRWDMTEMVDRDRRNKMQNSFPNWGVRVAGSDYPREAPDISQTEAFGL